MYGKMGSMVGAWPMTCENAHRTSALCIYRRYKNDTFHCKIHLSGQQNVFYNGFKDMERRF